MSKLTELKKELDTVIKIGVEGQREINRKLSVENKKLKANLETAVEALNQARIEMMMTVWKDEHVFHMIKNALEKIEGDK